MPYAITRSAAVAARFPRQQDQIEAIGLLREFGAQSRLADGGLSYTMTDAKIARSASWLDLSDLRGLCATFSAADDAIFLDLPAADSLALAA
jgi:hypothetical protein